MEAVAWLVVAAFTFSSNTVFCLHSSSCGSNDSKHLIKLESLLEL